MNVFTEEGTPIHSFNQCGTRPFEGAGAAPHTVEAKIDFIYPEVIFPSDALYRTWGEANIRELVRYHHALLRKTVLGKMFPVDDNAFAIATEKAADFFVEALGGAKAFSDAHGHPALRMRHLHLIVDEKARDIWLMMYRKAMAECAMPAEHAREFWGWIEALSIRMINRRTTLTPITRYPYEPLAGRQAAK
ncbi:MAG: globin [Campylobacterales bacterium]|nr:globin [Campylobacterales bacterium]